MSKRNGDVDDNDIVSIEPKKRKSDLSLSLHDYTVAWVCQLHKEYDAAMALLDHQHDSLPVPDNDKNTYGFGSVASHNIVVATVPRERFSYLSSARVVEQMTSTFVNIKFAMMIGIGGGIPSKVKLGDVVVGYPQEDMPAVVQFDKYDASHGVRFKRTGALAHLREELLKPLQTLKKDVEMNGTKILHHLSEMSKKHGELGPKYLRPDSSPNEQAAKPMDLGRYDTESEPSKEFKVHYGLIASNHEAVHDSNFRDMLHAGFSGNLLCLDTGAAKLMPDFPCIVIRGICDYADSNSIGHGDERPNDQDQHQTNGGSALEKGDGSDRNDGESAEEAYIKNEDESGLEKDILHLQSNEETWQRYAAAAAAAFAKDVLSVVPVRKVQQIPAFRSK